jgi:hypothetical protein
MKQHPAVFIAQEGRMKLTAWVLFAVLALAACAQLQPDSTLPGRYDSHSRDGDAALWGSGD